MKVLILILIFSVNASADLKCWVLPKLQDGCFELQFNNLKPATALASCPIVDGRNYRVRCGVNDSYKFDQVLHDVEMAKRATARQPAIDAKAARDTKRANAIMWCNQQAGIERDKCDTWLGR